MPLLSKSKFLTESKTITSLLPNGDADLIILALITIVLLLNFCI